LNQAAVRHAEQWFTFFGDLEHDPPHSTTHTVWGREVFVPKASGKAAMFNFNELIGQATSSADYLELVRNYEAFIITEVPGMNHKSRDLARRFITFIDAVYEGRVCAFSQLRCVPTNNLQAKLVLTMGVPITELFLSHEELDEAMNAAQKAGDVKEADEHNDVSDVMRSLMDDLGMNMNMLKNSSIFTGDEERFAFARALSRLVEMGSKEWVERGMGLESKGGKSEKETWKKVRSRWREDSY
jgi:predicted ATPase